jgi:hypothetical protein
MPMGILPAMILFAVALPTFGQSQPAATAIAPDCGAANADFEVRTDNGQHPTAQPDAGKALVYFLQDDAEFGSRPRPTTRFGIDGQWVGATHSNSYFYISVDLGEHHLCASWQGLVVLGPKRSEAALGFTAEAGKIYYFRANDIADPQSRLPAVIFKPLDADEARLLMSKFSFSVSNPKK